MSAMADNIERVIVGKREAVGFAVAALFSEQHLLLEGAPGVGKTMLARAVARSIDGSFKRIQGTSDLLPADITGAMVFDQRSGTFEFVAGPVFANVVLFDEINRTGPKTQSALLEVMDERRVSADGADYELPQPFFVVATRNPGEHHGTFPLPEGELDRFGLSIDVGYPDADSERRVVFEQLIAHPIDDLEPVAEPEDVVAHRAAIRTVHVDPSVIDYAVSIVSSTRERADVSVGASTRATVSLTRVGQALAVSSDRDYVLPDDVKRAAPAVLAHRILLTSDLRPGRALDVVNEILHSVRAPVV
jgi:MoxR-like ATPase